VTSAPSGGGRELRLLGLGLLLLAGGWLFAVLAHAVMAGESRSLDERVLLALRVPHDTGRLRGPVWLARAAVDVTSLGRHTVVVLVLAAVAGFLVLLRKPSLAALMLVAGAGGVGLNAALKLLFGRARPEVVPHLVQVDSASFPSGHSLLSAAVYLTIGVVVARAVHGRALQVYVVAVAALLTLLVGATRVMLGVHYPTDVVAGWLAGGLWALVCGVIARVLQRRGTVESPGREPGAGE
jgi:undecaprenyl-diphosphatase